MSFFVILLRRGRATIIDVPVRLSFIDRACLACILLLSVSHLISTSLSERLVVHKVAAIDLCHLQRRLFLPRALILRLMSLALSAAYFFDTRWARFMWLAHAAIMHFFVGAIIFIQSLCNPQLWENLSLSAMLTSSELCNITWLLSWRLRELCEPIRSDYLRIRLETLLVSCCMQEFLRA